MTDKEIQASDEEMEQFNVLQNEKCVLAKEEKLNDLMNRISFALKDTTLQQGFEIICKRIAELEKENKISEEIIIGEQQEINELKKKLDFFLTETVAGKEYRSKEELDELEKENEELKTQIKSMRMGKGTLVAKLKSYEALWNEQQKVIKEKQAQIEQMKNAIIDFSKADTTETKYETYQKLLKFGK